MYNDFKKNRIKVQKALLETGFWQIFKEEHTPFCITETSNSSSLKKVTIDDFPISDDENERVFIIHLENNIPVFSKIEYTKTTEKVVLLLSADIIYVFMFELKSSLQAEDDNDISAIKKKVEDTIGRISVMLTSFVFDEKFEDVKVQYKGIVFYNKDNNLINDASSVLKNKPFYKAFEEKKKVVEITTDINGKNQVEVFFFKNPTQNDNFSINFSSLFFEEWETVLTQYSDLKMPFL